MKAWNKKKKPKHSNKRKYRYDDEFIECVIDEIDYSFKQNRYIFY